MGRWAAVTRKPPKKINGGSGVRDSDVVREPEQETVYGIYSAGRWKGSNFVWVEEFPDGCLDLSDGSAGLFVVIPDGTLYCLPNSSYLFDLSTAESWENTGFKKFSDHKFKSVFSGESSMLAVSKSNHLWGAGDEGSYGAFGTLPMLNGHLIRVLGNRDIWLAESFDVRFPSWYESMMEIIQAISDAAANRIIPLNQQCDMASCYGGCSIILSGNSVSAAGYNEEGRAGTGGPIVSTESAYPAPVEGLIEQPEPEEEITGIFKTIGNGVFAQTGPFQTYVIDSSGNLWACGLPGYCAYNAPSDFVFDPEEIGRKWFEDFWGATIPSSVDYWRDIREYNTSGIRYALRRAGGNIKYKAVSSFGTHTLGLDEEGSLYAWGSNIYGELGLGTTGEVITVPTKIDNKSYKAVAAGYYHCAAIDTDGFLYTWGRNNMGQLGLGDTVNRNVPVKVAGDSYDLVKVSGGNTLALKIK